MARAMCNQCGYPESTCLCEYVVPVESTIQFDILQHPSEVNAAKNTARLCELCMSDTRIWVGEQPDDFLELQKIIKESPATQTAVLYPSDSSLSVAAFKDNAKHNQNKFRMIVLDGTWKKAYKLWQLNHWLHDFPAIKLEDVASNYHIRKSPKPGGVSTLEAIAAIVNELEPAVNVEPLIKLFNARQAHFSQRS